jgi:catechol 2,3-dioxygenase-like lactoylglutathione lyase family enzyme
MKGLFHTGITVSDLDRSIAFYRDVLGLEPDIGPTDIFEGDELSRGVGVPEAKLRLATFKLDEGTLELIQYLNPLSTVDNPMPANTLGAMHISFQVENAEETMRELSAKGVDFLSPINVVKEGPLAGWNWVYFKDPDGITMELVEYNPP